MGLHQSIPAFEQKGGIVAMISEPPQSTIPGLTIRFAQPKDSGLVLEFIRDLAEYEKLSHEVTTSESQLRDSLFTEQSPARVLLGFLNDNPAAFALYFYNFSTFLGRRGIFLEDLFVKPVYRGRGIGKAMLTALSRIAVAENCGRLEWSVLDWNEPAIGFYRNLGAVSMDEWTTFRLTGESLSNLANQDG